MLIEFKLHNGKVPYFVKDYLSYKVKGLNSAKDIKDRYLGTTVEAEDNYIPDTLVELTKDQFIERLKTAEISKGELEKREELSDKEKEQIAKGFLEKNG